jgi:hypothetical protein
MNVKIVARILSTTATSSSIGKSTL